MNSIKIIHQPGQCIGCNSCVTLAPQNWRMNKETGKSELIGGCKKGKVYVTEIFECDVEANQKAAEACPMNLIKVEGRP